MKFTDGFWLTKPEFEARFATEIVDLRVAGDTLTLYAPYKRVQSRGDTLNLGQMTVTVSPHSEGVLRVTLCNHAGGIDRGPAFELAPPDGTGAARLLPGGHEAVVEAGPLCLRAARGPWGLSFEAGGAPLAQTGAKGTAMMRRTDGADHLVTGLALDVGELVYGLGERFTPFVKNGQSVDIWNEDGGTASEISYKNIPFYYTSRGYGLLVNHPGRVSFEVGSEKVQFLQFSVEDQRLEYFLICGPTPADILRRYTRLTGRAPVPPAWSFGLWLSTSFTTSYDEATVLSFVDGMAERDIPLSVFHFDCFWMKGFEWCSFEWDGEMFPDPAGLLGRLHERGLRVCVWINPYIAQKSPLFAEGMAAGHLLKRPDGSVWQWDMWQAGMALVDFTSPAARAWYQGKLKALLDMGVDCFKTDFGERVPTDVAWHDGADPQRMHNYYTQLYNRCVYELLVKERGAGEAVLFARSATVGGQRYPVHWGGDSTSTYPSMAESLRAGLSLADSGFAYWSHDIGGFEDTGPADLYKRWVAFGMLSSHSRLHGSGGYRVPWAYDEEASAVLRFFARLKARLLPYLLAMAEQAAETGAPLMRPMHFAWPEDPNCAYLDKQYMLGDSLLVAPVFSADGRGSCYLPAGRWLHLLSGQAAEGGRWHTDTYDYFSLPLFTPEGSELAGLAGAGE